METGHDYNLSIHLKSLSEVKMFLSQLRKIRNPNKEVRDLIETLQYELENSEYED